MARFMVEMKGSAGGPLVPEFSTLKSACEGIQLMAEIIAKGIFARKGVYPRVNNYPWDSKVVSNVVDGSEIVAEFSVREVNI